METPKYGTVVHILTNLYGPVVLSRSQCCVVNTPNQVSHGVPTVPNPHWPTNPETFGTPFLDENDVLYQSIVKSGIFGISNGELRIYERGGIVEETQVATMAEETKVVILQCPLEVWSQVDGAWYDAEISMDGEQLRVHFDGFSAKYDEFWEGDDLKCSSKLLSSIRLQSIQQQDTDCPKVVPGQDVCTNYKSTDDKDSCYYDARVFAVRRKPHLSNDGGAVTCNCEFGVAWLGGLGKFGLVYLGCGDICVICKNSVEKHSIASQLLRDARQHESVATEANINVPSEELEVDPVVSSDNQELTITEELPRRRCKSTVKIVEEKKAPLKRSPRKRGKVKYGK